MARKNISKITPLGVHINDTAVVVVLFEDREGAPYFSAYREIELGEDPDKTLKQKQVAALLQAKEEIAPSAKTCIIGLNAKEMLAVQPFEVNPKEKERFIRSEANLKADEIERMAEEERIIAIDRLPNTTTRMLSIAKLSFITSLIEICNEAGLEVLGIDNPLAAWQRTMDDRPNSALLELVSPQPMLYIFSEPVGTIDKLAPSLSPEKLAARIRENFVNARKKASSDVRHIFITGKIGDVSPEYPYGDGMPALINSLKVDKGLEVSYVTFGKNENPTWAFAAALAGWSFGKNEKVIKANLLPIKKNKVVLFGIGIEKSDWIKSGVVAASVAFLLGVLQFSMTIQVDQKQKELDGINDQLASMATQTNNVGQLTADLHRLQEIARDSKWLKASGQMAALRLVYIGNAVPQGAWIQKITHSKDGWTIDGGAKDLNTLANVAKGFQNISPGLETSFQSVDTQKQTGYKVVIREPYIVKAPTPVNTEDPTNNQQNQNQNK